MFIFLFHLSFFALNQHQSFQKNKEKISEQMQQDMFKLAEFNSIH